MRRLLLLALLLALPAAAGAQGRSLDIRDFASSITVRRSGSMLVREQITVKFDGEWNGIYRTIPVEYRTEQGANYTLRIKVRGARDDAGAQLRHELEREGGNLKVKIWVPNARDATRSVTLEYEVSNGLRFFENHDELYWNVTGTEWSYPIRAASAEVYLPPEVSGLRTTAYTGAYGSVASEAEVEQVGNMVRFRTRGELGLREGLTVVVGWDPGVVERPGSFARATGFLGSNLLLLVPVLVAFLMHGLWRRYGRDPELGSIAPRYEPPAGLTPAEVGTLLDLRVDMRDITATLVDLAVRGYLEVEESERAQLFGLIASRDYTFVRLMPASACQDLKEHERDLLNALFADGNSVRLSDLENKFYKQLPGVKDSLTAALVKDGYYVHNPNVVRAVFFGVAVAAGFLVSMIGGWLSARYGIAPATAIAAGVLSGLVIAVVGWFMPARTVRGTHVLREIRGFAEFVERVESDRMERLVDRPELFEKYLPFAMAFGLEKRWARAFDGICTEPPRWYRARHGGGPFRTSLFISDLGRMSQATSSTLRSAPRSSSGSSGFGGGGFSGGGFGGGGGGGF